MAVPATAPSDGAAEARRALVLAGRVGAATLVAAGVLLLFLADLASKRWGSSVQELALPMMAAWLLSAGFTAGVAAWVVPIGGQPRRRLRIRVAATLLVALGVALGMAAGLSIGVREALAPLVVGLALPAAVVGAGAVRARMERVPAAGRALLLTVAAASVPLAIALSASLDANGIAAGLSSMGHAIGASDPLPPPMPPCATPGGCPVFRPSFFLGPPLVAVTAVAFASAALLRAASFVAGRSSAGSHLHEDKKAALPRATE